MYHYCLVDTTKSEKINNLNAIAKLLRLPMWFVPITELGRPAHSAEETGGTLAKNLLEKLDEARKYMRYIVNTYGEGHVLNRLGIKPEQIGKTAQIIVMAEDSGISFGKANTSHGTKDLGELIYSGLAQGKYQKFATLLNGIRERGFYHPDAPFPGAETVHIIGALGGNPQMIALLEEVAKNEGLIDRPFEGCDFNRCIKITSSCSLGGFFWRPGIDLATSVESLLAGSEKIIYKDSHDFFTANVFTKNGIYTTESARIPIDHAYNDDFRTCEEIGGAQVTPLARFRALETFAEKQNIKPVSKDRLNAFPIPRARDFNVALIGAKSPSNVANILKKKINNGYGTISQVAGWPESLVELEKNLIDNNDCFVFMPLGENPTVKQKIAVCARLTYVLVHKAVDPEGKSKPVIICNADGSYDGIVDDLVHMFNRAVYADKLHESIRVITDDDPQKLKAVIAKERKNYHRVDVPVKNYEQEVPPLDTTRFNVAVLCSASLDGHYALKSKELTNLLIEEGYGVVWGEGDRHMMGGVYEAYQEHRARGRNDLDVRGTTTNNIAVPETQSGKGVNVTENFRANCISKRLEYMAQDDAFILMEGGIGSDQELMMVALYRHYEKGNPVKPLVIQETALSADDKLIFERKVEYIFGVKLREMSVEEMREKHIYYAKTPHEAVEFLQPYSDQFTKQQLDRHGRS